MLRTMISTAKNQLLPVVWTLLIENRISSMPTDIVKRLYMTIPVLDQKKVKPGDFEAAVAPRFGESESMRHEEPVFRKDGSTFQLVEEGLRVPRRGKASLKHGFVNAVAAAVGVAVARSVREASECRQHFCQRQCQTLTRTSWRNAITSEDGRQSAIEATFI